MVCRHLRTAISRWEVLLMGAIRRGLSSVGPRRIAFTLIVLGILAFLVVGNGIFILFPILGWFPDALGLNPELGPHRLHALAVSLTFWVFAIGLLVQLRSPRKNVTGLIMALLVWVGPVVAYALTNYMGLVALVGVFGGSTVLAAFLHPSGRGLLDSFRTSRLSWVLLALVVVAAVPMVAYAATQVGLQTGAIQPAHGHDGGGHGEDVHQEHLAEGHFATMAGFALTVIAVGLLASLRADGWWMAAWVAGILAIVLGLVSLLYPETASAVGPVWGVAATVWGGIFIGVAEYTQTDATKTLLGRRGFVPTS